MLVKDQILYINFLVKVNKNNRLRRIRRWSDLFARKQAMRTKGNPNHPKLGSSIKVEPLRNKADIQAVKTYLADRPRDLCLFTLGINTAYRACELLSLRVGQVASLSVGDRLEVKQSKTGKHRAVTLNMTAISSLHSSEEMVIGFSQSTAFPASNDFLVCSK